jgi:glycosyltransferase involved in cell wall biosynthesis
MDRDRFLPELVCLKELGPLGEELSREIPAHENLIHHKYDLGVLPRLTRLFRQRRIDAVVTVGAGDKMFWGRLAAWRAKTPVVLSALHSTGWPDGVGKLNRALTRITDGFLGVANEHGRFMIEHERFPRDKVFVIPNGVDVARFSTDVDVAAVRQELGIASEAPLVGIVAALRPEKNHELFLRAAKIVRQAAPNTEFLVVGDGPCREPLLALRRELKLENAVHFLGTRSDIPRLVKSLDLFLLTSHNEANPVSILEAMAAGKPVVAPNVGSISESVADGVTGALTTTGTPEEVSHKVLEILNLPDRGRSLGECGYRTVAAKWSLETMVQGYEELITAIYRRKSGESISLMPSISSATPCDANVPG